MEKRGPIITLGRKYGAGGREIGEILSKLINAHYYDKELMRVASNESGIEESFFHIADERPGDNLLYKVVKNLKPKDGKPTLDQGSHTDENLFKFQSEVIKQLANSQDSCIFVGRCADYILRDSDRLISIFIDADIESRLDRIERRTTYDRKTARKNIQRVDKERNDYYNYYTGWKWSDLTHYDLYINSGKMDAEDCAKLIYEYIKLRGFEV